MAKESTVTKTEETSAVQTHVDERVPNATLEGSEHIQDTGPQIEHVPTPAPSTKKHNRIHDEQDMKKIYEEYKTHSAVIRFLAAKGYTRSEISDATGRIYQHVRNILVQDAQRQAAKEMEAKSKQA